MKTENCTIMVSSTNKVDVLCSIVKMYKSITKIEYLLQLNHGP